MFRIYFRSKKYSVCQVTQLITLYTTVRTFIERNYSQYVYCLTHILLELQFFRETYQPCGVNKNGRMNQLLYLQVT